MTNNDHEKPIQVFWPLDVPTRTGYCYGWRSSDTHVAVVGLLQVIHRTEAEDVLGAICLTSTPQWLSLKKLFKVDPQILGRVTGRTSDVFDVELFDYPAHRLDFVYYRRPSLRQLRFFTLEPLQLDVSTEANESARITNVSLIGPYRELEALDLSRPRHRPAPDLATVVDKVNCACDLDQIVQRHLIKPDDRVTLPSEAEFRFRSPYIASLPFRTIRSLLLWIVHVFLRVSLGVSNARLLSLFVHKPVLKDVSATIQQIDTRLEQASFLPIQFRLIRRRSRRNVAYSAAQYISFYNCIWLVLNDVIVGTAVGAFFCENSGYLGHMLLSYAKAYTVDSIRETLFWLDNWPVGLKLNTELSRFFCLCFVGLISVWDQCLTLSSPYAPHIIYFIGCCGTLGVTMSLSLLSDLLSLLTLPLYLCYMAATAIFSSQLSAAYSLFNVFRGKRRNVLRNRVDSMEYDLDQILLGTILFTLVAFLFPTILAYYLFFASVRLVVILLHATLETSLAFMNHFPLFVLMLRVKDPSRLPGGIHFEIVSAGSKAGTPHLIMKNTPIPFSQIFFQHFLLWSRLSAHYHPLRLLKCLVSGIVISPIPRYSIRYSMIPERRASFAADTNTSKHNDDTPQ